MVIIEIIVYKIKRDKIKVKISLKINRRKENISSKEMLNIYQRNIYKDAKNDEGEPVIATCFGKQKVWEIYKIILSMFFIIP